MANSLVLYSFVSIIILIVGFANSHPGDSHSHADPRSVSDYTDNGRWYHPLDHPLGALFKRQNTPPPTVGSPQWAANYPQAPLDPAKTPQAWLTALQTAIQAGLIPNISVSTLVPNASPVYPNGQSPTSAAICSFTYECTDDGDIINAPNGMIGIAFDDGPLPTSPPLYAFLKSQGQRATHFFIGNNILNNPTEFLQAYQDNQDDIAVHTYTHPYMTTLTNEQVIAELGWTMQIIHDSTGGKLPRFWRPPYGDTDNRVRAIAKQIFGLTCVIWNQDSADWQLTNPNPTFTPASVEASLVKFISGPKSPGLLILEHELSTYSVQAFIEIYPQMKAKGWDTRAIPDLFGLSWYLNAVNSSSPVVQSMDVAQSGLASLPSTIGTASTSTTSTIGSTSSPPALSTTSLTASSSPNTQNTKNSASSLFPSSNIPISGLIAFTVLLIQQ